MSDDITIKINVGKVTTELSVDKARELWKQLDSLFGEKKIDPVIPLPTSPMIPKTYGETEFK